MSVQGAQKEANEAASALLKGLERFQRSLSVRILSIMAGIRTNPDGTIISTPDNIGRVNELIAQMKSDFADAQFRSDVRRYLGSFQQVTEKVIEGFGDFDGVQPDTLRAVGASVRNRAEQYLTDPNTYDGKLWNPLADQMIVSTAKGDPVSAAIRQVADFMDTAPITAQAAGYAESAPTTLQRTVTIAASEQTGAQFFLFQGRPIKSTRQWCRDREGQYWHIEEIRQWGRDAAKGETWPGMVAGTNESTIFIHLGGWYGDRNSCRHTLLPVLRARVPKEALDRMRAKGLIK